MNDLRWWLTVIAAVAVKLLLSEVQSWRRAIASAAAALFVAVVFTDPVLAFLGWDPVRYRIAIAVVLALFGENLVRRVMDATGSPTLFADLIRAWRGK